MEFEEAEVAEDLELLAEATVGYPPSPSFSQVLILKRVGGKHNSSAKPAAFALCGLSRNRVWPGRSSLGDDRS